MKIIESSVENITPSKYDLESIYKHIERCGRTCYKSENKITDDSYKKFMDIIKSNKHGSVLEHGTVYMFIPIIKADKYSYYIAHKYLEDPYSDLTVITSNRDCLIEHHGYYMSTNMRVILENGWEDDLKYLCEPTKYHKKRYTFRVVCGIDISREWNRHRTISVSEQSTRYCNYSKEKFGGELTFIKPDWLKYTEGSFDESLNSRGDLVDKLFIQHLVNCEGVYMNLLKEGVKPQNARKILPLDTATEVIYTAFESDWEHFLSLRSSKAGATGQHPDINVLANQVYDMLNESK